MPSYWWAFVSAGYTQFCHNNNLQCSQWSLIWWQRDQITFPLQRNGDFILDLYSPGARTSYRKISRSIETGRLGFKIFPTALKFKRHFSKTAVKMPVKFQSNTITITQFRGFETSRDLVVRHHLRYTGHTGSCFSITYQFTKCVCSAPVEAKNTLTIKATTDTIED